VALDGKPTINLGLEGIYFMESKICKVDGKAGKLYYYGYDIEALAARSNFEETSYLLLHGELPNVKQLADFSRALSEERNLDDKIIDMIKSVPKETNPMHTLSAAMDLIGAYDKNAEKTADNESTSIRIISKIASVVAAIGSIRATSQYTHPDPKLSHTANFLYMLNGEPKPKEVVKLADTMFLLHAEHSSNASTFSGIVTISTLSDIYSAVVSAINTLKGPLHGGADEAALKMITGGIGKDPDKYIDGIISSGNRIMGFGHRVYKTYDPRAVIIKEQLKAAIGDSDSRVKEIAETAFGIEEATIKRTGQKGIWPNVDFFSGPVYSYVGIEPELFTPVFALSRAPGWCSHIMEYLKDNRLIRPTVYYTGETGRPYKEINSR
jgi:citrate synthase